MSWNDDESRDDWFAEPDEPQTEPTRQKQLSGSEDDWFQDTRSTHRVSRSGLDAISRRRIAAAAGALVVLLLILWAAGAFSSSSSPSEGLTTSSVPTTSTTTSTTTKTPTATPAPTGTLTPGSSGVQVKRLQRALAALGYRVGKVDGSYGPATKNALARFQKANGLSADGVLGPKTLRVLKAKLAAL